MHQDEYYSWLAYREKYGHLNPIRRQENGFALLATLVQYARGIKNAKMTDFIFTREPESEGDEMTDPRDFINMFKAE